MAVELEPPRSAEGDCAGVSEDLPPPPKPAGGKGWVLPLILVAAAGGIVALVMMSFKDSTVYSKGVEQVVAEKQKWVGKRVRVEGVLVRGTLQFQEKPCVYRFDATRGGQTLHIRYPSCIKPDTLRDDMPEVGVTAEGTLTASGDFEATNVLAKCPSKYEMKDKAQKGYPGAPQGGPAAPPPVVN